MTVRLSTALRNALVQGLGFGGIFNRGSIRIYTGAQPVSGDAAETGTLLGIITANSGALTAETPATGTIVITGGNTSVATVTVGSMNIIPDGAVPYNTSTAQTASDLCDAINRNGLYSATVAGSTLTIRPRPGTGAAHNALALSSTGSVTATYGGGTISGGVSPVNGLYLGQPAAGVIAKPAGQVWSFNGVAAGTAGWFRFVGSAADAGGVSALLPRMDGSIAVSGGDMQLSNIAVVVSSPHTCDTFTWTQPAA